MARAVSGKQLALGPKPARDPASELWVKGDQDKPEKINPWTARLTVDVTRALRGRIKIIAFERGTTVAEMLRELLEREYEKPMDDAR